MKPNHRDIIMDALANSLRTKHLTMEEYKEAKRSFLDLFDAVDSHNASLDGACPRCKSQTSPEDMTEYKGKKVCEGCAESLDEVVSFTDPHGKGWGEKFDAISRRALEKAEDEVHENRGIGKRMDDPDNPY